MNTSKDYLTTKNPGLLKKLRAYRMADEVCEEMDDFAIELATSVMPQEQTQFINLVKQLRQIQKLYSKVDNKKARAKVKELGNKIDQLLNR